MTRPTSCLPRTNKQTVMDLRRAGVGAGVANGIGNRIGTDLRSATVAGYTTPVFGRARPLADCKPLAPGRPSRRKGIPIMAEIFRPSYTVTDPKTGKRIKKKSRTWHIRYYTPDGERHRVKGYRDKKATESKAAELERRGIRVDAGLVDPPRFIPRNRWRNTPRAFAATLRARGTRKSTLPRRSSD